MENTVSVPENLIWAVVAIGILIQFVREFPAVEKVSRFLPYLAIAFGIIAAKISGVPFPDVISMGVAIGLMAAGGYDAIKAFSAKSKTDDASNYQERKDTL